LCNSVKARPHNAARADSEKNQSVIFPEDAAGVLCGLALKPDYKELGKVRIIISGSYTAKFDKKKQE